MDRAKHVRHCNDSGFLQNLLAFSFGLLLLSLCFFCLYFLYLQHISFHLLFLCVCIFVSSWHRALRMHLSCHWCGLSGVVVWCWLWWCGGVQLLLPVVRTGKVLGMSDVCTKSYTG